MLQKSNILYVDDESDNLFAFRSLFRRQFNVLTANGGEEALELMGKQHVPIVLSDQRMPQMTGLEFCQIIKEKYPQTIRIIITGYSETKHLQEAVSQGVISHCLRKPWDMAELTNIINAALAKTN